MNLTDDHPDPERIVGELEALSGGRVARREDLLVLLEAARGERRVVLDELSFHAKFAARARGIMDRIGRNGEGYDRLAAELGGALERIRGLLGRVLAEAPPEVRKTLTLRYLGMTPEALQELLVLCGDLRWYKNWLLDRRSPPGG